MAAVSVAEMEERIVRHGDLVPCKTAFIDAHTPGSNQKDNFTIIGGGVSESPDQHVHIKDTPGFNIGAAGQPPHCRNSLHSHHTAEVFLIHKGRWRFFWGVDGTAGEVVLEEGDLIDIPTGIFRGFENIGDRYGFMFAVLGGDDAGGGVIWAPRVIEDARDHGLVLMENGKLVDTKRGQALPEGVRPMPTLTPAQLEDYPEPSPAEVVPASVARYWDMKALSTREPAAVIGTPNGSMPMISNRPGFEVAFLQRGQRREGVAYTTDRHEVALVHRGHWKLAWGGGERTLNPGDTAAIPPGIERALSATGGDDTALFLVRNTDDRPGPTRRD